VRNTLYYGDNLRIMREHIRDESVDLVYLDPPFNSARAYGRILKSARTITDLESVEDIALARGGGGVSHYRCMTPAEPEIKAAGPPWQAHGFRFFNSRTRSGSVL